MLALNDSYVPSHDQESAASANTNWRVCAIVLLIFIVAATFSAVRKDVTQGFDEVAHASYIAHLQHSGEMWPAFEDLRMLDPSSFHFTDEANYLNHPSPYYLLLARIGPNLEGHPQAIMVHRLLNVVLAAIGLDRTSAYIANIIPWRPPGNRTPTPQESQICLPFILRQIELADPDVLVCLGGPSSQALLGFKDGIRRTRGRWLSFDTGKREIRAMATFHPAYVLRQGGMALTDTKRQVWSDLKQVRAKLDELQALAGKAGVEPEQVDLFGTLRVL